MDEERVSQIILSLYYSDHIMGLLLKFFNYDIRKFIYWFEKKNPLLGNISPKEMINRRKGNKLLSFIKTCLHDNNMD